MITNKLFISDCEAYPRVLGSWLGSPPQKSRIAAFKDVYVYSNRGNKGLIDLHA